MRAFLLYARSVVDRRREEAVYRAYMARCMQLAVGAKTSYFEVLEGSTGGRKKDFDAQKVVDDVIARAGLEVTGDESA